MALTVEQLQEQSRTRQHRWHDTPESQWTLLEWAGAMAGEVGECANVAKKIRRLQTKMRHIEKRADILRTNPDEPINVRTLRSMTRRAESAEAQAQAYRLHMAKEAADAILYGICIFNELKVDAEDTLRGVFNATSIEYDFPERV